MKDIHLPSFFGIAFLLSAIFLHSLEYRLVLTDYEVLSPTMIRADFGMETWLLGVQIPGLLVDVVGWIVLISLSTFIGTALWTFWRRKRR